MPKGSKDGWCVYCRTWNVVHLREEEDYAKYFGWYCDACFDWIEADEKHWRLHALMCMADRSRSHPLSSMVECRVLGHAIADFLRPPPWADGFP